MKSIFALMVLLIASFSLDAQRVEQNHPPNVIIILADDMGYGDLGCYGNTLIKTPHIDKLAREGCRFTQAYAPAAVCTPSRYGLLTGRYPWRTFLKKGVVAESPSLISPTEYTLPKLFKDAGYRTAAIGKWHLGFGDKKGSIDFNKPVLPGPNEAGFDYFFGLPVGHFYPPYVYMRNHLVVGLEKGDPISRDKLQQIGGKKAMIKRDSVNYTLFKEANDFVKDNRHNPFFLYLAVTIPHLPFDVRKDFSDSGPVGGYGDVIRELDQEVGKLMENIRSLNLDENTIVIFTSDNGGEALNKNQMAKWGTGGYHPNGQLRGYKGDVWEGGIREPFIIRYPNVIKPGTQSEEVICFTDLLSSFSSLLGIELPLNAGEDSYNVLSVLLDHRKKLEERPLVLQGRGGFLALRLGDWKYIACAGSGDRAGLVKLPPDAPPVQLYNIKADPEEKNNLYKAYPQKVNELNDMLEKIKNKQ